ncbi:exodeoxyribonuclease III [Alkalibacillus almallahensis]|uniref:exodeoxyribonuclease III n=1 Tax=Alkalibacillus almallahensis TaxID=1379154 RepID=UPI001423330C|nr:exodeoxyribonuclease III [Alkalibacillus almallahensis]NIK13453.1 exodeoxyribonuclease-3 [Alkalibacillus almallahensis]
MKIISWNVNGLRAAVRKGFLDYIESEDPDIVAVQEIKLQSGQIELPLHDYECYWNYAERKGYSGTAIFTKHTPIRSFNGDFHPAANSEGRVLGLEFENVYLINVYTPNSKRSLERLSERLEWEDAFLHYVQQLNGIKPVIICGDLNVAHQPLDVKNDRSNIGNSGFTDEERSKMTRLLHNGFTDVLRHYYPERDDLFTWWSYMKTVRERNIGWRIDYFLISDSIVEQLKHFQVDDHIYGSDHCPIQMTIDV